MSTNFKVYSRPLWSIIALNSAMPFLSFTFIIICYGGFFLAKKISFISFGSSSTTIVKHRSLFFEEAAGKIVLVGLVGIWNFQDVFNCFYIIYQHLSLLLYFYVVGSQFMVNILVVTGQFLDFYFIKSLLSLMLLIACSHSSCPA